MCGTSTGSLQLPGPSAHTKKWAQAVPHFLSSIQPLHASPASHVALASKNEHIIVPAVSHAARGHVPACTETHCDYSVILPLQQGPQFTHGKDGEGKPAHGTAARAPSTSEFDHRVRGRGRSPDLMLCSCPTLKVQLERCAWSGLAILTAPRWSSLGSEAGRGMRGSAPREKAEARRSGVEIHIRRVQRGWRRLEDRL